MKTTFFAFVLAAVSTPTVPSEPAQEFLSWYNGWTVHTVWGLGKVSGSYLGTSIKCGSTLVPVRAVYDTHSANQPPSPEQTEGYATAANMALLGRIEPIAGKCELSAAPMRPNNSFKPNPHQGGA